jgi:hypothetical protein
MGGDLLNKLRQSGGYARAAFAVQTSIAQGRAMAICQHNGVVRRRGDATADRGRRFFA